MTTIEILFFGILVNITIALKYKFLGGSLKGILISLMILNTVLLILYKYNYGFSLVILMSAIVINLIYTLIYIKVRSRDNSR